jgi:hypothetical protein
MFAADQPRGSGRQLRVMASNLLAGHADVQQEPGA